MQSTLLSRSTYILVLLVALALTGCAEDSVGGDTEPTPTPGPGRTAQSITHIPTTPGTLLPEMELRQIQLQEAGIPGAMATGVTLDKNGQLVVLDAASGLHRLNEDGRFEEIWSAVDMLGRYGIEVGSPFSDVVAVGDDTFALAAISDGFLLDLEKNSFTQHFCYEPGWIPEPDPNTPTRVQFTRSLAYDPVTTQIIAQPQTIENDDWANPTESWLSTYDRVSGVDLQWYAFENPNYAAGGMAMLDSDTLLLGNGSRVDLQDLRSGELSAQAELSELGVSEIQGLAVDHERHTLLVIDGASQTLVEVALADVLLDK